MRVYVVLKRELEDDQLANVRVIGVFRTEAGALNAAGANGADEIQQWEVGGELVQTVPC